MNLYITTELIYLILEKLISIDDIKKEYRTIFSYQLVCKDWMNVMNTYYFNKNIFQTDNEILTRIMKKYNNFPSKNFNNNVKIFHNKILNELELYNMNMDINVYVFPTTHVSSCIKYMIDNLEFPKYVYPNLFYDILSGVQMLYSRKKMDNFLDWLENLLKLYNVFEYLDSVSNLRYYWSIITDIIVKENNCTRFIAKYAEFIDWKNTKIFDVIDEEFILNNKKIWDLWGSLEWNQICIKIKLSENFIENILINEIFIKREIHFNILYIVNFQKNYPTFFEDFKKLK